MEAWAATVGSVKAPKRYVHLESQNVTSFGMRMSTDVLRIRISRRDHLGLPRSVLNSVQVFSEERRRGRSHEKTKAEIGVV